MPKHPLQGPGGRSTTLPCAQDPVLGPPSLGWCPVCRDIFCILLLFLRGSFQGSVQQSQPMNMDTLSCNLALGTNPARGGRNNNNLGSKKKSFQPRISFTLSFLARPFRISSHLETSPEQTFHEIGDGLHDLRSLRKPHPNSLRPILRNRSTSLSSVA